MTAAVRLLLVDDEAPILAATRDLLREYGFEVETHSDAATIHERVAQLRPAVLLQDVRMPGLDVRKLVEAIRGDEATRNVKVVLFSADVAVRELARELRVEAVAKPFKPQTLLAALRG